jgi:N-methylhydantoinase A
MLQTNVRHDLTQTFYQTMDATKLEELDAVYTKLEEQGKEILQGEEVSAEQMGFARTADMRYVGQEYSVNVPVPGEEEGAEQSLDGIATRFHDAYKTRYGHSTPGAPIEFVNLRVAAFGTLIRETAGFRPGSGEQQYQSATQDIIFNGEAQAAAMYRRDRLPSGIMLGGPLVIEEETATTVVPPRWGARIDELGNIIITRKEV